MCDTSAVVVSAEGEELVLESVDIIRPGEGTVYMKNLFGEEKVFEGRIKEISLMKRKVVLEK